MPIRHREQLPGASLAGLGAVMEMSSLVVSEFPSVVLGKHKCGPAMLFQREAEDSAWCTAATIWSRGAIAPTPMSPQASSLLTGGTNCRLVQ
jgi:hypothetical protein